MLPSLCMLRDPDKGALCVDNQDQLDWLREQIEMRSIGLSWSNWSAQWSSSTDGKVGTIPYLREHLKNLVEEERSVESKGLLPCRERALMSDEELKALCPAPQMRRKTFKTLGTPTVQANALSDDRTELTQADILKRADQRRSELEAAGEIDMVQDRQPYPSGQVRCELGSNLAKSAYLSLLWY